MNLIEYRYGGWDGKKWLSDVYVLDTSNFFAQAWGCYYLYISFFFIFFLFLGDTTDVKFVLYAICFFKQYRWSGCSSQLLDQCHHLDVAIQLQWSKSDCLSMVAEVKLHHYPHIPSTCSAFCLLCNVFL